MPLFNPQNDSAMLHLFLALADLTLGSNVGVRPGSRAWPKQRPPARQRSELLLPNETLVAGREELCSGSRYTSGPKVGLIRVG